MTIGLRDLYYSVITDTDGGETYATPVKLAGAISADLTVTTADGSLYVDDALAESDSEFASASLKLGIDDLSQEVSAAILGQTVDESGVLWSTGDDDPPYIAVGFRAKKSGGKFRYVWLMRGKAKTPSESYATKGESIEYKTPEIELTFMQNKRDDAWKIDYVGAETDDVAASWFTAVPEMVTASA